ncbi:hypothetical protein MBLNU459_g7881t1 [Dothideomycetes sp. NU459]
MAAPNVNDTIQQLNAARNLALADPALYPQIVPGLLRIVGADAILELRRWGADFFAETFASPVLAPEHKQSLSLLLLDTLRTFLEKAHEDTAVVKSVVQTSSSIYPFVFRHIITTPNDSQAWQTMAAIKSAILRRMDSAPPGVRICCVKFVQRVVQVQTPGLIADPRRPDQNETSLALVPRDHPIIPPANLEAEASGLLDRLLGVLQDNSRSEPYDENAIAPPLTSLMYSDALLVTATLNSLGSLIKTRATIANKIIATTLNFNPLRLASSPPVSAKTRVLVKSMARTTMALLINIIKKNPNHPLAARISQYVDKLRHSLIEAFDETSRKRPAPAEPTDGLSDAKRQRVDAQMRPATEHSLAPPPLPAGPVSFAQLFTLTREQGLIGFDVNVIPLNVVLSIVAPLLSSIDKSKMDNAINTVRARYLSLGKAPPMDAMTTARAATCAAPITNEDDDSYEPGPAFEDTEQIMNNLDQAPLEDMFEQRPEVALGPFSLPPPAPLTGKEVLECSRGAVARVFGALDALDQTSSAKTQKFGFNRLAANNHDRDGWIAVISRLASRASAGLDVRKVKSEHENGRDVDIKGFSPSDALRESLYLYVIDDFRRRIDVAISWLNEEWYNDRVQTKQKGGNEFVPQNYERWMLKILDGIIPFMDAGSKLLIRFLSEIPSLDRDVLQRVTRLAKDPERVNLAVNSLHYLILLRPPVRDIAIDALEDLYRNYDDTRPSVTKLLLKWRPEVVQSAAAA